MPDWLPAVVVGGILIALAAGLGAFQWSAWKSGPAALPEDDETRQHAARQLRRRLQINLMIALVGVMIPLGDMLPVFRQAPRLFFIYWLTVLGLVVWMVVLALGDLASNLAQHRTAQRQLEVERRSIEQQIRRHRAAGNGHQGDNEPAP